MTKKIFIILGLLVLIAAFFAFDGQHYLSLSYIKAQQQNFDALYSQHTAATVLLFFALYVAVAGLSLPGAIILTLLGGALFGFGTGLIVVSFASTIGATLAFLASRYFMRSSLQSRYASKLSTINEGIEKEGPLYLFALRLVPVFPFFVINLLMGISHIKTRTFAWVSQLGMLPGTAVFVYAGTQLAQLDSLSGILSPGLIAAFVLLGITPLLAKKFMTYLRRRKIIALYDKPKKFDTNLVVIGAGSGGLVSAYIAAAVKAKVTLIERHQMGGDCLNTGCVPSKALIRSAKAAYEVRNSAKFGVLSEPPKVDFAQVMARVHDVIAQVQPHDSVERYTELGVDVIKGEAKIIDPYRVEVNGRVIHTPNIIVATGARPFVPNLPGIESANVVTSDSIWQLTELPKRLVVLGGGPIGCELAQAFARLGSDVTLVQRDRRLLPREDKEVSDHLTQQFERENIEVLTDHNALRFESDNGQHVLVCATLGGEVKVSHDCALIALGRKPNTTGFGLQELGVELADNGTIAADAFMTTNFANIHVVGDVTGPYQFTHVAAHQAWYASVNALFGTFKRFKVDYRVIPWATFTDPEIAQVGLNEAEAIANNTPYEITRYGLDDLDRAIADGADSGWVKILTVPGKDKILGVTIVGKSAGDLLPEFVLAMKHNLGMNKILGTTHIYPTMSEANKYAAGEWKRAHAPQGLLKLVQRYHAWKRN